MRAELWEKLREVRSDRVVVACKLLGSGADAGRHSRSPRHATQGSVDVGNLRVTGKPVATGHGVDQRMDLRRQPGEVIPQGAIHIGSEVRQRALVRVALASRDNRNFYSRDWLVHLGGWMIRWGESLESRYSAYNENSIPAHSTAKVH